MMVLLSIKKKYCDLILQGTKLFEFRKRLPSGLRKGDQIALYCSQPTSKVVAYVDVADVIQTTPYKLWMMTSFAGGIAHNDFSEYFYGFRIANAIQIGTIHKLNHPLSLAEIRGRDAPPQSFLYLSDEEASKVKAHAFVVKKNLAVFVGGVHGVGKTTFLNETLSRLGFVCFSASSLIKRHNLPVRKDKTVADIDVNQMGLIAESSKEASSHRLYALDGHFTLLSSDKMVRPIPIEVFSSLKLDCLILLSSSCEEIQSRMISRDGTKWAKSLIKSFVREEECNAKAVAARLGLPLLKFDMPHSCCWRETKEFVGGVLGNKFGIKNKQED